MSASTRLDVTFRGVDRTGKTVSSMEKRMKAAGKRIGFALAGAFGARVIFRFGKESVRAFQVQRDAEMKLLGVLKATEGAAGRSFKQITNMASAMQRVTSFGDEEIINASAILATFKQIKGEAFDKSLEAILDLSAAMDQDLKSSAVQVGKALNDPVKGIAALSRVGVAFTKEQVKMIKGFAAQNDVASAQKVILDELQGEFGGVAQAMADPLKQMANLWGDVKEGIGETIFELITFSGQSDKLKKDLDGTTDKFDTLALSIFRGWQQLKTFFKVGLVGFEVLGDIAGRFTEALSREISFKEAFKDFDDLEKRFERIFTERDESIQAFEKKQLEARRLKEELNDAAGAGDKVKQSIKNLREALSPMTLAGTYKAIQQQFKNAAPQLAPERQAAIRAGAIRGGREEIGQILKLLLREAKKQTKAFDDLEFEGV